MEENDNILELKLKNVARSPYNIEYFFSTFSDSVDDAFYADGKIRLSIDENFVKDVSMTYEYYKSGIIYSSREYNTYSNKGLFNFYDIYGNLLLQFTTRNDVLHGWAYVYMPKIKYTVIKYINGIRDKIEDTFNMSGDILWKCKYANIRSDYVKIMFNAYGKKHVMITVDGINKKETFFNKNIPTQSKNYINNILDNTLDHYLNGDIKCLTYYKNGLREGLRTKYYLSGEDHIVTEYKSDKVYGKKIKYYKNGYIQSDEIYVLEELHGLQKYYYPSGSLKIEVDCIYGQIHGTKLTYHENGNLASDIKYKNNIPAGFSLIYDQDGYILNMIRYIRGKRVF